MAGFLVALFIAWICSKIGPKYPSPLQEDLPQKSKRWARKALIHGIRYHGLKDPEYIARYDRKYKKRK